jgi:hypothetical protein
MLNEEHSSISDVRPLPPPIFFQHWIGRTQLSQLLILFWSIIQLSGRIDATLELLCASQVM